MSDNLDWGTRLLHIRFSRVVLFCEKWMSLVLVAVLLLASLPWQIVLAIAMICFVLFVLAHISHFNLEESAGMPVSRITMKF